MKKTQLCSICDQLVQDNQQFQVAQQNLKFSFCFSNIIFLHVFNKSNAYFYHFLLHLNPNPSFNL
jgi:hypothetical protein